MSKPSKIRPVKAGSSRNGTSARLMNQILGIINPLTELQLKPSSDNHVIWSDANVILDIAGAIRDSGTGAGGWHWANPKDEVIVTDDGNVAGGELAGWWVARTAGTNHRPVWPLPSTTIYWDLIGLTPILVDVPVTVDGIVNCTSYQAYVQMSQPYLK
jgi:hypothetical protein